MIKTVVRNIVVGVMSTGLMIVIGYVAAKEMPKSNRAIKDKQFAAIAKRNNIIPFQEDQQTGQPQPLSKNTDIIGIKLSMPCNQILAILKSKFSASIDEMHETISTQGYTVTVMTGYKCTIPQSNQKIAENEENHRQAEQSMAMGFQRKDPGSNNETVYVYTDSRDQNNVIGIMRHVGFNPRSAPLTSVTENMIRNKYGKATVDFGSGNYDGDSDTAIWSTLPDKDVIYPKMTDGNFSKFMMNHISMRDNIGMSLSSLLTHESNTPNGYKGLGLMLWGQLEHSVDKEHVAGMNLTILDYDALSGSVQFLLNKVKAGRENFQKTKYDMETQRKPRL